MESLVLRVEGVLLYSRVPNTRGGLNKRGGWEPLKETNNQGVLNKWGGQKFAKNGFLGYLLETSAFYMLRTVWVFMFSTGDKCISYA